MGIIGKTQGVNNAANPDRKAIKKIPQRLFSDDESFLIETTGLPSFFMDSVITVFLLIVNNKSTSVGGKHLVSSQTINSTVPFISFTGLVNLIFCLNTAEFSKNLISILKIGSSIVWPSSSEVFPISFNLAS